MPHNKIYCWHFNKEEIMTELIITVEDESILPSLRRILNSL